VPDGVDNLAMFGEPGSGQPVQRRHFLGQRPAQLQPEQVPEEVVVAKPRSLGIERHDERVGVLELEQDAFRPRVAGQQVSELTVDAIEQTGAQQQLLDVGRLAVQHFCDQVLRDRAVASGKLRNKTLGVGVAGKGDRREPQPGCPPFGSLAQERCSGVGQRDPRGVEQLAGFALGEAQICRADLG